MKLIKITNDVFDVVQEIKRIDDRYDIFFNSVKNRFELHHSDCYPTLQLVIPYNTLDYRTVIYVRKTRVGRTIDEFDVDKFNENLSKHKQQRLTDERNYKTKHLVSYYQKGGNDVVDYKNI